jgi:phosphonate transport system ATP-binding protein
MTLAEAALVPCPQVERTDVDVGVDRLSARYGEHAPVFSQVSFAVGGGEAVALIGANGTGKSTLLKCLLGLVAPTSGTITVFGREIGQLKSGEVRQLRSGIGFVSQKHNLVPRLTVLSNVVHGLLAFRPGPRSWLQSLAPAESRSRALAALQRVGLADFALRRAESLSGGQSQRVAIARALVSEPRLVLADEPAASLDPAAGEEVMGDFARVVRDTGATLVFTTHNLGHALAHSDRVLGLREGRLALDAATHTLALGGLRGIYD